MTADVITFPTRLVPVDVNRRPTPRLDDVPAQLRHLADAIDDSRIGDWTASQARFFRCATATMWDIFDARRRT